MAHADTHSHVTLGEAVYLNENQRFKARYGVYLRRSTYASLLIWLLIFLFSPVYKPTPYHLREDKIEILDIPDALDIPPPPKEIPRPQVPIEAAPDAEVNEDVDLAETLPENWNDAALPSAGGGASDTGNAFVAFDTKPEIVKWVPPKYPETARDMELQGTVMVNVLVGTDGHAKSAEVVKSVHPILDAEALKAALRCVFKPGKQRDFPVEVWVTLPYRFKLY
jgi:TonB family protein